MNIYYLIVSVFGGFRSSSAEKLWLSDCPGVAVKMWAGLQLSEVVGIAPQAAHSRGCWQLASSRASNETERETETEREGEGGRETEDGGEEVVIFCDLIGCFSHPCSVH